MVSDKAPLGVVGRHIRRSTCSPSAGIEQPYRPCPWPGPGDQRCAIAERLGAGGYRERAAFAAQSSRARRRPRVPGLGGLAQFRSPEKGGSLADSTTVTSPSRSSNQSSRLRYPESSSSRSRMERTSAPSPKARGRRRDCERPIHCEVVILGSADAARYRVRLKHAAGSMACRVAGSVNICDLAGQRVNSRQAAIGEMLRRAPSQAALLVEAALKLPIVLEPVGQPGSPCPRPWRSRASDETGSAAVLLVHAEPGTGGATSSSAASSITLAGRAEPQQSPTARGRGHGGMTAELDRRPRRGPEPAASASPTIQAMSIDLFHRVAVGLLRCERARWGFARYSARSARP